MRLRALLLALLVALAALVAWIYSSQTVAPSDAAAIADGGTTAPTAHEIEAPLEESNAADPRAERSREAGTLRSVSGRVVDARTGEALEGFGVTARGSEQVWSEDSSDARGRFVLTAIAERSVTLAVTPPYGWIALDTPRSLECNSRGEFDDVRILARPAGLAPFQARLVDELTREPVPHYLVRIGTQLGARSNVWSNADGMLVSEQELPESTLLLFGYDVLHPDLGANELKPHWYREVPHAPREGASEELELAIPVGPTFRLALDAPAEAPRERLLALVGRAEIAFPRATSTQHPNVGVLRIDDGVWVRFPPRAVGGDQPGVLSLFSLDGRWFGDGPVSTRRGIDPQLVTIRLERRSRVLGRAVDDRGEALSKASLTLFGRDRSGVFSRLESAASSANGLFEFPFAPAGAYVVRGVASGADTREFAFDLLDAEDFEFELVLPLHERVGVVSGIVRAPRDSQFAKGNVVLASSRQVGQLFQQRVVFTETDAGLGASFEIQGAPAGEYELHVTAWGASGGQMQDVSVDVTAPREGLVVELLPSSGLVCIEAHAVDARSKVEIESPLVELQMVAAESHGALLGRRDDSCFSVELLPTTRWVLGAEGYRPVRGAVSALEVAGGSAKLRVELTPGWGVVLEVLGTGFAPLEGVEVLADGKAIATTDARGCALVALDEAPASLELRRPGWRTELDSSSYLNNALRGHLALLRVWMTPD